MFTLVTINHTDINTLDADIYSTCPLDMSLFDNPFLTYLHAYNTVSDNGTWVQQATPPPYCATTNISR